MRVYDIGGRDDEPREVTDRIWTWANGLSFVRLLALPLIYLDLVGERWLRAFVLLAIFSATDWLDGYIARRFDQMTRLGALLDPVSDRVLFVVVGVAFVVAGLLPLWAVLVILVRDVLVVGVGLVVMLRGHRPPTVSRLGKTATFGLMFALPVFILARILESPTGEPHQVWLAVAWIGFGVNAVLYWLVAVGYLRDLRGGPPPPKSS
ncbi:CDP-alcohol phosphatidyltransferase family protein [Nitriliruptor alkaliphilus]|uniref:CDP-alcohol phosphatidyltransferase family protein n=1 Tax=Nitriliruptor alkaliphilus TaxID=427918 RepID=UPI000697174C|nr:CDP-alcohol phosphatidyltransferase family protein [Nitriliruptor alkaliphilus]